jgi:hypothetical protein
LKSVGGDERILGDLDDEAFGASACRQSLYERAHEIQIARLLGGDVDGDRLAGTECSVERINGVDHLGQDKTSDRVDQAELSR